MKKNLYKLIAVLIAVMLSFGTVSVLAEETTEEIVEQAAPAGTETPVQEEIEGQAADTGVNDPGSEEVPPVEEQQETEELSGFFSVSDWEKTVSVSLAEADVLPVSSVLTVKEISDASSDSGDQAYYAWAEELLNGVYAPQQRRVTDCRIYEIYMDNLPMDTVQTGAMRVTIDFFGDDAGLLSAALDPEMGVSVFHAEDPAGANLWEDSQAAVYTNGYGAAGISFETWQGFGTICVVCISEPVPQEEEPSVTEEEEDPNLKDGEQNPEGLEKQEEQEEQQEPAEGEETVSEEEQEHASGQNPETDPKEAPEENPEQDQKQQAEEEQQSGTDPSVQDASVNKEAASETKTGEEKKEEKKEDEADKPEDEEEFTETDEETFEMLNSAYYALPASSDTLVMEYFDSGVEEGTEYLYSAGSNASAEASEYITALGSSSYNGNKLISYNGTPYTKKVYDGVKQLAVNVAAGTQTSTIYTMVLTGEELSAYSWTAAELGLDSLITAEGKMDSTAPFTAVRLLFDRSLAVRSVIRDCPYEMFWFGNVIGYSTSPTAKVYTDESGVQRLRLTGLTFSVKLKVSADYAAAEAYTTDSAKIKGINTAIVNANQIVTAAAGMGDDAKLAYFRDKILGLSGYNHAALSSSPDYYGNPWQIIYLFDGIPETKVVCEGYSKGFQYLCDKSVFASSVQVYCIAGLIYSDTWSGGGHMWNIVVRNGEKYVVDLTNYKANANPNKSLFMARPVDGSVDTGYIYLIGEKPYHLEYFYDTRQIYHDTELTMELYHEYDANDHHCLYCSEALEETTVADGTCGDSLSWTLSNFNVLRISGNGTMKDAAEPKSAFTVTSVENGYTFDITKIRKVVIESGVTSIGAYAFAGFTSLTEADIPETVTSVGANAFNGCTSLAAITIPYSVQTIGENAFTACNALKDVYYPGAASEWALIGGSGRNGLDSLERENALTIHKEGSALSGTCGEGVNYEINGTTLTISGNGAMNDYDWKADAAPYKWAKDRIRSVVVSDGVTRIGDSAFYEFAAIDSVTLPNSLTAIGIRAFSGCSALTSVAIPAGVLQIGEQAFAVCGQLQTVALASPCSLAALGEGVFFNCSSLTAFGENAVPGQGAIIPRSVTEMDDLTFYGCTALRKAALPANSLNTIYYGTFANCESLETVNIPANIQEIGGYAFYHCKQLSEIVIPAGVAQIYDITFSGCTGLQTVTIPTSLTDIWKDAFYGCTGIQTVNYAGTEDQWKQIEIQSGNDGLKNGNRTCSVCSEGHSHNYQTEVLKAATCVAEGRQKKTCEYCHDTYEEVIPATNKHTSVTDKAVAATCTAQGKTAGSHCSVCGKVLTAQKSVAALGHSYNSGTVTKQPTCTGTGVRTYTCTRCGAKKTASVPAAGHKAVTDKAVAATCTAQGKTAGSHCSVCGKVLTAQKATAALGHSYNSGTITKQPTCTAAGVRTYTCTRCGAKKTSSVPATGHKSTVSKAAVSSSLFTQGRTQETKCSVCGKVLTASKTLPYQNLSRSLTVGTSGSDVRQVQQRLSDLGYNIAVDGDYGNYTASVVQQFQQDQGIYADGVTGNQTLNVLRSAGTPSSASSAPAPSAPASTAPASTNPAPAASSSSALSVNRTLQVGSTGSDVQAMQQLLKNLGYDVYPDGDFGTYTQQVVIAFQSANGLYADGVVGSYTVAKMNALAGNSGSTPAASSSTASSSAAPATASSSTSSSSALNLTRTLSRGMNGEDVRVMQQKLASLGYSVAVDGDFGYYTEQVVIAFQSASGLYADGVVGPITAEVLNRN